MNPSQRELSAETIGELSGGGFGVAINKQIDKLTKDIGDYPVDYRGYNVDISPEREERLHEEYERKGNPDRLLHEMAYEVSELNTLLEFELGHA